MKKVCITSDNENYQEWLGKDLYITYSSKEGPFYDNSCYPALLCNLEDEFGNEVPFSLYEWEFKYI